MMNFDGLKNVTVQQLECLYHLVAQRSFSVAARRMRLSQPSLTKHIQNLENAAAVGIIHRSQGGISLTPGGKVVYDYACRVLQLRAQTEEKLLRLQDEDSGDVEISASTIPATYILPYVLAAFFARAPRIRLQVHTADSEEVLERVLNQQVDIGFVGKKPPMRRLTSEALWQDRLVLAVPVRHPWCRRSAVPLEALRTEPFIMRSKGSATRAILEQNLKDKLGLGNLQLKVIAELGSSEAVKEAILAGAGISILSVHAVARELRQGLLHAIPIEGVSIERYIYLVLRRTQGLLLPHQEVFLNFVRSFTVPSAG